MKKGIIEVLQTEMLDFSAPVIINNIPALDGLLCSQRQVIWGMYKAGMTSNKQFYKMLKASGRIFDYYVLGDAPLCGVMKNMGNNYILHKYLMPKGSFGNKNLRNGTGSAARYIECKLDPYSECMIEGINKNAVTMKKNYDATEDEPVILPSKIPNILVNLRMSIAVSEANKMPSHNLEDVCNSIIYYIKTKDINKAIELIKVPDLPSGGAIIYNKDTFNTIYKTGKGSFINLGKYKYNEKTNTLTIYEIPYTTYIENIGDELEKNLDKFSKELIDYHDGSDKNGLRLELYLKKNVNINTVIQKLRKYTSFESKFACNFTILDLDGKTPKLMSLQDIYEKWIFHRITCIKNETQFDINKNREELNKLYGLQIINNDLDKAIQIIRSSKTEKIAAENLINHFKLNKKQAEYISTIRLLNINQEWIFNKISNIKELEKKNIQLNNYYNSEVDIKKTIISQLEEVKKTYGKPRQTEIIYEDDIQDINTSEQLIEEYSTYCTLSEQGYFHKLLKKSDNIKSKDDDKIIKEIYSNNKSTLLLFSNTGNCYKLYEYELQDDKPSNFGQYLPTLLQLEDDEQIINMISVDDDYKGNLIEIFENGKIANIELSAFKTETKRSKLKNSLCLKNGKLLNMFIINKDVDIILQSSLNKVLITNTSYINSKASKSTNGNQIMKSKKDSKVIFAEQLQNINSELIHDIEYYKNKNGIGIGVYLKEGDIIELK